VSQDERLADVQAVLFDMDGTLVDSTRAVERAWLAFADDHGLDGTDTLALAGGPPASVTIRRLATGLDEDGVARAVAVQSDREADMDGVVVAEGAHALIALVERRGMPWAVVTSADRRLADSRLAEAGITPPVLVTADDVAAGKPDPQGYRAAAMALGVPIERCLVVEDSKIGAEAGLASGALVAGLVPDLGAQLTVRDLPHLTTLLDGPA